MAAWAGMAEQALAKSQTIRIIIWGSRLPNGRRAAQPGCKQWRIKMAATTGRPGHGHFGAGVPSWR